MRGAVSLRDLAQMREDQHHALADYVIELQAARAGDGEDDGDSGPLLDFEDALGET